MDGTRHIHRFSHFDHHPHSVVPARKELARTVLFVFVTTFIVTRITVLGIMLGDLPDMFLHIDDTHIHHLSYGILLLAGAGAYLLFGHARGTRLIITAILYGIGLSLICDEFGMWINLDDDYWQHISYDAISIVTGTLAFITLLPARRPLTPRLWLQLATIALSCALLSSLLLYSFDLFQSRYTPTLERIQQDGPQ